MRRAAPHARTSPAALLAASPTSDRAVAAGHLTTSVHVPYALSALYIPRFMLVALDRHGAAESAHDGAGKRGTSAAARIGAGSGTQEAAAESETRVERRGAAAAARRPLKALRRRCVHSICLISADKESSRPSTTWEPSWSTAVPRVRPSGCPHVGQELDGPGGKNPRELHSTALAPAAAARQGCGAWRLRAASGLHPLRRHVSRHPKAQAKKVYANARLDALPARPATALAAAPRLVCSAAGLT
jgi:hypothetical protein